MKAAVLREYNAPLEIEEIQIDKPGPYEVLTRTAASGICHSDLHVIEGGIPMPTPCVLGHEPAGIVEAVGSEVTDFKPGDHVIGCLNAWCGKCNYCLTGRPHLCMPPEMLARLDGSSRLTKDGDPIMQFALSSFAEQMLTHERSLVKIRDDMPLDRASLIGCGVTTGIGAVLRTAKVEPGAVCAVIGCGGVGLSALQGCRIAGASRIIAVDTMDWKLELARELGATDVINASNGDPVAQVQELTGGGVDYAFECIGLKPTIQQAVGMAAKGGAAVLVGVLAVTETVELSAADITLQEKRILGSFMGSNAFRRDMPQYVDYYLDGRLRLDEMISKRIPLEEINPAFDAMKAGEVARSVIVFD
ncbi:MAG: Zn-dependent alcohol dehydrogenase [Myxococcota bacterium]|jgi:S-(hydroxymethyl)glutathione dehydrogenase/alcohol dehydrogenase